MNKREIVTHYVNPPIPVRCNDWSAHREDDEEGLWGWGSTEEEAIADLLDLESEQ